MKTVLALDPGASTGYCVIQCWNDDANKTAVIIAYGTIEPDLSSQYQGDHAISLQHKVKELIDTYQVEEVGMEDYFASGRFAQGTDINYYYRGAIQVLCRTLGIHYEMLNISNWKTHIAGRSTPTKLQKMTYGKAPAKKIMIQQALWERWRIRFPNHQLSEKTGKPIIYKYDSIDAVGQAIYYAWLRYGIMGATSAVPVPADVQFKKQSAKTFSYDA